MMRGYTHPRIFPLSILTIFWKSILPFILFPKRENENCLTANSPAQVSVLERTVLIFNLTLFYNWASWRAPSRIRTCMYPLTFLLVRSQRVYERKLWTKRCLNPLKRIWTSDFLSTRMWYQTSPLAIFSLSLVMNWWQFTILSDYCEPIVSPAGIEPALYWL